MDIGFWIMIVAWAFVLVWIPFIIYSNRKTHPRALFVLFFAEMWERFSYYGMRALLTLYMAKELFAALAEGEAKAQALGIYGSYTSMVYLTPIIGGILADKVLGFRKAVIFGGLLMTAGHFALALEGMVFPDRLSNRSILYFTIGEYHFATSHLQANNNQVSKKHLYDLVSYAPFTEYIILGDLNHPKANEIVNVPKNNVLDRNRTQNRPVII